MALPLYVAVSTDTGCFAYANTTAQTHAVAAALLRTGIDYQTVNKVFFRTKSRRRMQLEAAHPPTTVRFTTETGWRCCPCPSP